MRPGRPLSLNAFSAFFAMGGPSDVDPSRVLSARQVEALRWMYDEEDGIPRSYLQPEDRRTFTSVVTRGLAVFDQADGVYRLTASGTAALGAYVRLRR